MKTEAAGAEGDLEGLTIDEQGLLIVEGSEGGVAGESGAAILQSEVKKD